MRTLPRLARLGALLLGAALIAWAGKSHAQAPAASDGGVDVHFISGTVVDAQTGDPLPEALIRSGAREWRTGERGEFRVPVVGIIVVRRIGYEPQRVGPLRAGDSVRVAMVPTVRSLETVIVTAARREQKLKDAIVTTEVVSRREIEQSGASDISSALSGQTGIQLDGGVPSGAGVLLQGLGSQRVLVLIDGQPLVGRVNGNMDLSRFPTGMVERIEVVKGPQSTLYGSEAMGGVVNLITRRPTEAGLDGELALTAGSQGRRDGSLSVLARLGAFDAALDAGRREVDLLPGRDGETGTFAHRWDAAPRIRWTLGPRTMLDASTMVVDERQRYRIGQLYQHSDNTQFGARVGFSRRLATPGGRYGATVYHSRFEHLSRKSTTPEPVAGTGEMDVQTLLKLDLSGSLPVGRLFVDGGVEAKQEGIEADRVQGGERTLGTVEPFLQGTWGAGALSFVPGVRASFSEQWGSAITPRLAVMWRPRAPLAFRASVSRGYRAPDFKELYLEFVNAAAGYAVRGNPDLRPERSVNVTTGVEYSGDRVQGRASAYHNAFSDFIETMETSTPGEYTYTNIASGLTSGVDVDGALVGSWWRLDGGYAWLRARDAAGEPLLGRPTHSARLTAAISTGRGPRLSVTTVATGAAPIGRDAEGNVSRWRERYVRVDARAAQRIVSGVEFVLAAENVFDERMGTDWPGFTGRLLSATLRLSRD